MKIFLGKVDVGFIRSKDTGGSTIVRVSRGKKGFQGSLGALFVSPTESLFVIPTESKNGFDVSNKI